MARKKLKAPTLAGVDASEMLSSPVSVSSVNRTPLDAQASIAVSRLVARFGLPPSTALAVAEANRWGR